MFRDVKFPTIEFLEKFRHNFEPSQQLTYQTITNAHWEIFHSNFLTLKRFFVNMGKEKKEKKALDESQTNGTNGDTTDEISYEDRLNFVSVIAKPMASKKLAKKVSICNYFRRNRKNVVIGHILQQNMTYSIYFSAIQSYQERNEAQDLCKKWFERRPVPNSERRKRNRRFRW